MLNTDWKIAVAAIIGLSVVASAFIFSGTDALSGLSLFQQTGKKEVAIFADLDLNQLAFDLQGTSTTYMKFNDTSVSIKVGRESFDPLGTNLVIDLEDFNGKASFYNGVLFTGTSESITIGNFLQTKEKYSVAIGSQNFEVVRVANVTMNSFTQIASGTVDVGYGKTKTTVRLNRDTLTIGGFTGSIEATNGRLYINGFAEKVISANKINVG